MGRENTSAQTQMTANSTGFPCAGEAGAVYLLSEYASRHIRSDTAAK